MKVMCEAMCSINAEREKKEMKGEKKERRKGRDREEERRRERREEKEKVPSTQTVLPTEMCVLLLIHYYIYKLVTCNLLRYSEAALAYL
jgi:hypothetical protein